MCLLAAHGAPGRAWKGRSKIQNHAKQCWPCAGYGFRPPASSFIVKKVKEFTRRERILMWYLTRPYDGLSLAADGFGARAGRVRRVRPRRRDFGRGGGALAAPGGAVAARGDCRGALDRAGASGRNAGMLLAGHSDHYDRMAEVFGRARAREIWAATLEHQRLLREFLKETGADIELEECGSWRLGFEEAEAEHLARSAKLLKEDGFQAEFHERNPMGRGFHGALGIRDDAGLHPLKLVRALLNASGAQVYDGCEVSALESTQGGLVVRTSRRIFTRAGFSSPSTPTRRSFTGFSARSSPRAAVKSF